MPASWGVQLSLEGCCLEESFVFFLTCDVLAPQHMKQLPGRVRPPWLQQLISFAALVLVTIWLVTLLPVLLVVGLIAALLLIPVLKQIRQDIDHLERTQRDDPIQPRDVTPWHRRVWNRWLSR